MIHNPMFQQESVTIEFWIYRNTTNPDNTYNTSGNGPILRKGSSATLPNYYQVALNNNNIVITYRDETNTNHTLTLTNAVPVNTWSHIAMCIIPTDMMAFVNLTFAGSVNVSSPSGAWAMNTQDLWYTRSTYNATDGPENLYLDELRISKGCRNYVPVVDWGITQTTMLLKFQEG